MERPSNTTLALLGGLGLFVLILIGFAVARNGDQDVLGDAATFSVENPDLNKACAGQSLYEQIKRALFREAGQLRGKDLDAYHKIAGAAAVRMENPAAEGENRERGLVDCAGSMAIDLPPGVATIAGRHQLMSDIYYSVDPAGGAQGRVVQLRGANALVGELAGLTVAPVPMVAPVPVVVEPSGNAVEPADPLAPLPPDVPESEDHPDENALR